MVAGIIYKSLSRGKEAYDAALPSLRVGDIVSAVEKSLREEPMVSDIEYISVASYPMT